MRQERKKGITRSATLHFFLLVFAIFGLPALLVPNREIEPSAITVEILPITGITNVKPSEVLPAPTEAEKPKEEKKLKEEPKKAEKPKPKPQPRVKTEEPKPKPEPVPKLEEKKKEAMKKPEEEKKKEKEKKPKEEDLMAVLKAVKETAEKEEGKESKPVTDGGSKSKSLSQKYDPTQLLSMSEKDAIRSQFAKCWNVPAGAKDAHELIVVLDVELNRDGSLVKASIASASRSRYLTDSFFRAAADSALRAVHKCSPLQGLPPEKFDTWREMELTFDPKEMLF